MNRVKEMDLSDQYVRNMMGRAPIVENAKQIVESFKEMAAPDQDVRIVIARVTTVETFKEMDSSDQDVRIKMCGS